MAEGAAPARFRGNVAMTSTMRWILLLALLAMAPVAQAQAPFPFMNKPDWLGPKYLESESWPELDALVDKLATSRERNEEGRFELQVMTDAISDWMEGRDEEHDQVTRRKLEHYVEQFPKSAFAPIAQAMQMHLAAWRARGYGFASTVTPEGWQLFREHNQQAWRVIEAAKSTSDRLPVWYLEAISIATDIGLPSDEILALLHEGARRYPGYYPLYIPFMRQYAPRWGGDYRTADAFVRKEVAAKSNPDGEILYTQLYWLIDQYEHGDPGFFEESQIDWSRMRTGFELLMKQFPNGKEIQANFVAFACRAGDGATYYKWRRTVDAGKFMTVAPNGISLEVCDARFTKKV
jgi:hypothetical protein